MTGDGVKTKAIGDRARFGSHLLSNLLSSTGKQCREGSGMTRRKREGAEGCKVDRVLLGASIFILLTLSYCCFSYSTFIALFSSLLRGYTQSIPELIPLFFYYDEFDRPSLKKIGHHFHSTLLFIIRDMKYLLIDCN